MGSNANLILKKKNRTKLKSTNHFDDKSFCFFCFFAFFFLSFCFLDKSWRQILLRPGHHHGEHTSCQPVTAALPGVCKGKSLFHVFIFYF